MNFNEAQAALAAFTLALAFGWSIFTGFVLMGDCDHDDRERWDDE